MAPLLLLLALFSSEAAAGEWDDRTLVTFHTACARCHAGQCSGRLSFSTGTEGAAAHLRRYAGETEDIDGLFRLLALTKEECRSPLPDVAPPPDGVWGAAALAALTVPSGVLLPLGPLQPGAYRLEAVAAGQGGAMVELLDAEMEPLDSERFVVEAGRPFGALFEVATQTPQAWLRIGGEGLPALESLRWAPAHSN